MRAAILLVVLTSFGCAQALVEHAAAAAGGSVGGVAGKKVSDGLTSVFEKVDQHAKKAAKAATASSKPESSEPLLEVGPGVPKQRREYPPPPPPVRHTAVRKAPAPAPVHTIVRVALPTPDPPAEALVPVTVAELRSVTRGMHRAEVLKLGEPAARISMYDDGHLLEIYRYLDRDLDIGVVRLTDGAVSSIQLR